MPPETAMEKTAINIDSLVKIAIWLDGYKAGKGNLLPLGTQDLTELWNGIKYLQGDVRFTTTKQN